MLDSDNPATPATDDCEAPTSKGAELSQRFLIDSIAMRCLQSVSQAGEAHTIIIITQEGLRGSAGKDG
jgi:hypothetical protein